MRITGSQIGPVTPAQIEKIKKSSSSSSVEAAQPADTVELSSDVENIAAAKQVIANTPDVRQEKVASLQREVQNGTYKVPAQKIAEKMLAEGRFAKTIQKK